MIFPPLKNNIDITMCISGVRSKGRFLCYIPLYYDDVRCYRILVAEADTSEM